MAAPPTGDPDLVITDISRDGDTIRYSIENHGSAPAASSTSALVIDGVVKGFDTVGPLAAGASSAESFGHSYGCSGVSDTILVHADKDSVVSESSEGNNAYSESWSCMIVILKPDLVILDIWKVSEITGDKVYYKIKNQGSGGAVASTTALRFYPCIHPCLPVATDAVGPLAPGEVSQEKFATYNWTGFVGTVGVNADDPEIVNEIDEGNNERQESTASW